MNKRNIKLFVIIGAILFCCFFSTVAYSAIYTTMGISGVAYARPIKDVRITDFKIASSNNATSQYEEFGVNSISMKFNFSEESSSILYDVEVTNYGNVDVGLFDLHDAVDNYPNVRCDILNQIPGEKICDENGKCNTMAVKTFQITCMGSPGEYEQTITFDFREYHSVTYTGITNNNYPTEVMDGAELNVDFTEELKRIGVYQNGVQVAYYPTVYVGSNLLLASVTGNIEIRQEEPVARLVSGDLNTVGSEVCIKDECFYIISNDGSTVSMLAKYNLYVGGYTDSNTATRTEYGSEATGLQDSSMLGIKGGDDVYAGVVAYSNGDQNYSESTIKNYVDEYSSYLLNEGASIENARLITVVELENLGCVSSVEYTKINTGCTNSYEWLYASSYWTQTPYDNDLVYSVMTDGQVEAGPFDVEADVVFGVRPVIEMSVDEIKLPVKPVVVSGDYDTVGSGVCIGKECFYVISSTDTTVTMIAKYNLYVGGEYNDEWSSYGNNVTGLQNSTMLGWQSSGTPYKGVTAFSDSVSTQYSGSIIEKYVNNYSSYLSLQGVIPVEARLITYDELITFGFEEWAFCGDNTPEWLYATSYWTMSEYEGTSYVWIVGKNSYLDIYEPNIADKFGVRPVITISKEYF